MKILSRLFKVVLLVIVLFFTLVRVGVWIHVVHDPGPWPSLVGGALISSLVLFGILTALNRWVLGRTGSMRAIKWRGLFAIGLVAAFCTYGVIYLSDTNAKAADVRSEFRTMHPVLRMAVSTVILGDRDLLVTDASRKR